MPSRVIHYARDQIYFECDSMIQSEDGFCFGNEFFSLQTLLYTQRIRHEQHGALHEGVNFTVETDSAEGIRWRGGWIGLVQDYSKREFTVPLDKLPALSGLAKIVAEGTGDRYFAGLWASHIYEDLFWRVRVQEETFHNAVPLKREVIRKARKPTEYRAPSWSWASIDAPVRFIALAYKDLVARFVECETTPSGIDPYGRVKDGRLVIEVSLYT